MYYVTPQAASTCDAPYCRTDVFGAVQLQGASVSSVRWTRSPQAVAHALARLPSGRWVVACSGGPDSTALVDALAAAGAARR